MHDGIDVLHVVLLSDCNTGLGSLDVGETKDGTRVLLDIYGIERLHRILGVGLTAMTSFSTSRRKTIRAAWPCLMTTYENADFDASLTAIPGSILADIYEKYGTRVLELNVQAFLGVQGRQSVNAGLRRTIQEEPTRFIAYNNRYRGNSRSDQRSSTPQRHSDNTSTSRPANRKRQQTTVSLHRARKRDQVPSIP